MKELQVGQYYLHQNGTLIYKAAGGVDGTSCFVKQLWQVKDISKTPQMFADFLNEAKERGAKESEIVRLAKYNNLAAYINNWRIEPQSWN